MTAEQEAALQTIYNVPAGSATAFRMTSAARRGSEIEWPAAYDVHVGYLHDSIGEWDPTYDPNRDGDVSLAELKGWDPYDAPAEAQAEMRLLDLTGDLRPADHRGPRQRGHDRLGPRRQLATSNCRTGRRRRRSPAELPHPGDGSWRAGRIPLRRAAIDALESWITHRQTGGAAGAVPGRIAGLEPLPDL